MAELFIHDPEDVAYAIALMQGKLACEDNTITFGYVFEWAETVIGDAGDTTVEATLAPAIAECKLPMHIRFFSCNLSDRAALCLAAALEKSESIVGLSLYANPNISEEGYIALDQAATVTKAPLRFWNNCAVDNDLEIARAAHRSQTSLASLGRLSWTDETESTTTSSTTDPLGEETRAAAMSEDSSHTFTNEYIDHPTPPPEDLVIGESSRESRLSPIPEGELESIDVEDSTLLPEVDNNSNGEIQILAKACLKVDIDEDEFELNVGEEHQLDAFEQPELLAQQWEELEQKEKRLLERKRRLEIYRRDKESKARQDHVAVTDRLQSLTFDEIELEAEWLRKEATYQKEKQKLEVLKMEFENCLAKVLKKQQRLDFAKERLDETRHEIEHLRERKSDLEDLLQRLKLAEPQGQEPAPCPICYSPMEKKQALQCGHIFCPDCVIRLQGEPIHERRVCAICRERITTVVALFA